MASSGLPCRWMGKPGEVGDRECLSVIVNGKNLLSACGGVAF